MELPGSSFPPVLCEAYEMRMPGKSRKGKWQMNYTYMVKCQDGSLYTGWTNHLEKRIQDHNAGKGAKYTKSRRPVTLVYYETYQTKEEAMKREYAIKRMKRKEKLKLVQTFLQKKQ